LIAFTAVALFLAFGWSLMTGISRPMQRHWTPGQAITLCGPEASRPIPSDCPLVTVGKEPEVSHRPYDPTP